MVDLNKLAAEHSAREKQSREAAKAAVPHRAAAQARNDLPEWQKRIKYQIDNNWSSYVRVDSDERTQWRRGWFGMTTTGTIETGGFLNDDFREVYISKRSPD
jgi:hypothetical protein